MKALSTTAMCPKAESVIQFCLPSGLPIDVGYYVELSSDEFRAVCQVHSYVDDRITALVQSANCDDTRNQWVVRWSDNRADFK